MSLRNSSPQLAKDVPTETENLLVLPSISTIQNICWSYLLYLLYRISAGPTFYIYYTEYLLVLPSISTIQNICWSYLLYLLYRISAGLTFYIYYTEYLLVLPSISTVPNPLPFLPLHPLSLSVPLSVPPSPPLPPHHAPFVCSSASCLVCLVCNLQVPQKHGRLISKTRA